MQYKDCKRRKFKFIRKKIVTLDEINTAILNASKEILIDLDEINELNSTVKRSLDWFGRALVVRHFV